MIGDLKKRISILVIEHNPVFRSGLKALFDIEDDCAVIAAVPNVEHARKELQRCIPNVILLGLDEWGDDIERSLSQLTESTRQRVIVLGRDPRAICVRAILGKGAHGYLTKDVSRDYLISVVREVVRDDGRVFISVLRSDILAALTPAKTLSAREQEIMFLVAKAMSNTQIASTLRIATGTVKRHLNSVFTKLDAVSRIDAVNKALAASLIVQPRPDGAADRERD